VTFKDLNKRFNTTEEEDRAAKSKLFFDTFANKPFWINDISEHKAEASITSLDCQRKMVV